jgi:CBS domain-containing protein
VVKLLIETRCHRVPVVDAEGKVVNVISQSSIIQFLYAHKGDLGAVGAHTVEKMACGTSPVYSVQASDTIFSAFELMAQHDIMG